METALNAHLKMMRVKFQITPEERDGNIEGWNACKDAIIAKINDENFLINMQSGFSVASVAEEMRKLLNQL